MRKLNHVVFDRIGTGIIAGDSIAVAISKLKATRDLLPDDASNPKLDWDRDYVDVCFQRPETEDERVTREELVKINMANARENIK